MPAASPATMYSHPRCACFACSDLSGSAAVGDDVDGLYRHPRTTAMWRYDDDERDHDDVYYNSNIVDVDRPRRACGCVDGDAASTVGHHGQSLQQANPLTTCMLQKCGV